MLITVYYLHAMVMNEIIVIGGGLAGIKANEQ
jgi:heterodisulfide reductase subunit A-like polyferredoxin